MMHIPSVIVLFDDSNALMNVIEQYLTEAGYPIVVTVKGTEVYPLVCQVMPNVLILDMHLKNETGWQTLLAIKGNPATTSLPVIVCSTTSQAFQTKAETLKMKHCVFLEKPFDLDDLLNTVDRLVQPPERF